MTAVSQNSSEQPSHARFLAIASAVTGLISSALLWHVYQTQLALSGGFTSIQSALQFENFGVVLAGVIALIGTHVSVGRHLWRYVLVGLVIELTLSGTISLEATDDVRFDNSQAGAPSFYKTLLTGQIFGYFTIVLALAALHSPLQFPKSRGLIYLILGTVTGFIGIVILWTLNGNKHTDPSSTTLRPLIWGVVTPAILMIAFVAASLTAHSPEAARGATFLMGTTCIWFLEVGSVAGLRLGSIAHPSSSLSCRPGSRSTLRRPTAASTRSRGPALCSAGCRHGSTSPRPLSPPPRPQPTDTRISQQLIRLQQQTKHTPAAGTLSAE